MPPKSAVQSSFYAADGGLASIPRDGYRMGNVVKKAGEMIKLEWVKLNLYLMMQI